MTVTITAAAMSAEAVGTKAPEGGPEGRLVSLDVMRGATVAAMVIVNNPAVGAPYVYRQMTHAPWDGWTFADTIFPAFLFMVGASLALGRRPALARMARRVVVLVGLGLVVNAAPLLLAQGFHASVLAKLRLPGVLQRIALAEALAVVVVTWVRPRWQPVAGAVLLLASWLLLTKVSVPGIGAGHLTPTGNLEGWVDRTVFGTAHLYRSGTVGYDPEGVLGTLGATVSVLAGYWAGRSLRRDGWRLAIIGVAAISAGSLWGHALPVNKRLWTPSYTVLMAGVSLCVLALLHELFDRSATFARAAALPWRVLGANALVVYVGTELSAATLGAFHHAFDGGHVALSVWVWASWLRPHVGARAATIVFGALLLAVWWRVAAALHRHRVYLRA